jgi:ribosomal protein S18 acetylase RimI-like enzyme
MVVIRDFQERDRQTYYQMSLDFYDGDATLCTMDKEKLKATFDLALLGSPLMRGVTLEETETGRMVGYGLLAFYWSNEAGGLTVQLEEVYIDPSCRGQRLGSQFMEWMLTTYPQAKRFRLEVCPQNLRVKKLYESFGFRELEYIQMVYPG